MSPQRKLRKQIVELMTIRATLTARHHADEWARLDKRIATLQRRLDRLGVRSTVKTVLSFPGDPDLVLSE